MQQAAENFDLSTFQPGSTDLEQALRSLDLLRASLQSAVAAPDSDKIPVLRDVISHGPQANKLADERAVGELLEALRTELDMMIEDMLSDARLRFEHLLAQSSEELKTAVRGRLESRIAEQFLAR